MKRIRTLGIACVMAMALTATAGAGSASAAGFETKYLPTDVTASLVGESEIRSNQGYTYALCTGLGFEASLFYLPDSMETTEVEDGSCNGFSYGSRNALKMNGCQFTFHPENEELDGSFKGTYDIGPPGCGPITRVMPQLKCEISIGAQTGLPATFSNVASGVEIETGSGGLKYTQNPYVGSLCPGGTGAFTGGSWVTTWKVGGEEIEVVDKVLTHIGIEGSPKALNADRFPLSIIGKPQGSHQFGTAVGPIVCSGPELTGELASASSKFALSAVYGPCTTNGIAGTQVKMNGCQYVVHVNDTAMPFSGSVDIQCPEGKALEVLTKVAGVTKCTTTYPPQNGISSVSLKNNSGLWIELGLTLSGLKYQQKSGTGAGTCSSGSFENGTYTGTELIRGYS